MPTVRTKIGYYKRITDEQWVAYTVGSAKPTYITGGDSACRQYFKRDVGPQQSTASVKIEFVQQDLKGVIAFDVFKLAPGPS